MHITLNGAPRDVPEASTIADLLQDPLGELLPGRLVERELPGEPLEARPRFGPERIVRVGASPEGDEEELVREEVGPPELVERGDHLAVREIAGRPEEDEDARVGDPLEAEPLAERVPLRPFFV